MRRLKFLVLCLLLVSVTAAFAAKSNKVTLVSASANEIVVKFEVNSYDFQRVQTPNGEELVLVAPTSSRIMEKGAPDLTLFGTSVIIPDKGKMKVDVIDSKFIEIDHIKIAPSKGNLLRTIDPNKVPYEYGKWYKKNRFYPGELAEMTRPYIARDFRGQAVIVYPFQYNPVNDILRVYSELTVKISKNGNKKGDNEFNRNKPLKLDKLNREFKNVYSRHFINFDQMIEAQLEYTPLQDPIGDMLIICYSSFMDEMAPFVSWKENIGYNVDLVNYSTIGSSSALKTYVANYYNSNGLDYLLLVGDHAQVPTSSTTAGDSDNNYGYIVGSDHYLDIFVGRFSAETAAHVTTQVNRTIYYEQDVLSSATWFRHAIGMASAEGPGHNGEYDATHMDYILTDLSGYGYTTHKNYQSGGSTSNLSNLINNGAGTMWYCGHGSDTAWTCGWTFSITNVNALVNENELPAVFSVACVIGNFKSQTCFCESWLRATNNGNPTGAVAHAGSTINQSWNPPMDAQDEMADILVSPSGPKRTFGGVFVNGMFKMIDLNGSGGESMADTWTCFGDSSVQLRTPGTPNGPGGGTPQPPVANFYGNPTTVDEGQSVNFTDTSTNNPTSWSWSFEGGTPSTSTAQNPTITYNTAGTYDVSLTVSNSAGSDSETKYNYITVEVPTISYCTASGNNQNYEYIAGVAVGDLNNTSGASGYSDFTGMTANLTAGASTNVSLTPGFVSSSYNEYWKIWIDYNVDGDFDDSGEEVFSGSGSSTVTGSFTVPSSADGVTTRMRVIMEYGSWPTPCGTFTYGEVEDYTVNISGIIVNPPVAAFTASPTTVTEGGTVFFTDQSTNNPTSWSWSFPGGTPSSSTAQNPTVTYNTAGNYNVTLTVYNSAGSDSETKYNYITVNPGTVTYCTSSGNNQNYEYIARVRVGSIDNSSGASGYTDFTYISTNVTKGASVSVYLTPGFVSSSYTEYWRVWIDYNKDGDFADSGETVFSGTGSSTVSGSFTVPTSASSGSTRMRVSMRYGGYPSSCGTFTYGEVEDYTVNIQ
ncbi:MAG: PKD domain-containing protein [Candidatus Aminicenantes bacterium]|nr:PKD domain-containing protein [Candidatus Aminicenantes bacterium]NIM83443.1 PKD domain-containing protein [Candidatus Aminicenantes bacterium]NIN22835.1 PKD domain-containing protein [Candidatus Aminicenantes bacterium]NIN46571.1 PKD domain-containing protein [Candidatus Aminicenantes bacterium]NIN89474.1 PKD domain-containing protein [Candidatus Aminicenantes bacterium]